MDYPIISSLLHLLIIVPILIYIGFQRESAPQWIYMALLGVGFVVFLYHIINLIVLSEEALLRMTK
jgi:membrane protease YdiL (CAAX protease family)